MTVREWFRKDRAALWLNADHPAHGVASEIDHLADIIVQGTNVPDGYSEVADVTVWLGGRQRCETMWLPAGMIREHGQHAAARALDDLLYRAWPIADREKYDWTYNALRRANDEARKQYFNGLCD